MSISKIDPAGLNVGQIGGRRNLIINGAMQVAQRGTQSITSADQTLYGSCDRWRCTGNPATARGDLKQSTDAPSGHSTSFELDVTTAGTPTSTYFGRISQSLEGYDLKALEWGQATAKPVTLTFWIKSNVTGDFTVSLLNANSNRSYFEIYTINSADTWEQKTITFSGDTVGSFSYDNTKQIEICFTHSADAATRTVTTQGSWVSGSGGFALASANPNIWSSTDNYLKITGVQLEVGTVATPFEHRSYGEELALCQRYFQSTYEQGVAPGTATTVGGIFSSTSAQNNYAAIPIQFPVKMRSAPSVTTYDDVGNSDRWHYSGNDKATFVAPIGSSGGRVYINNTSAGGEGTRLGGQYTADAEL